MAQPEQMNAANLTLCNLGADLFVVGEFKEWRDEYNDLPITLSRDGATVNQTNVDDALGGPKPGALWVKQEAKQRGFSTTEDTIYMMGSCGKALPAESGHYVGDYGALGKVELTIR